MTDSRRIASPAYVLALALIMIPLADVAISLFPWRMTEPRWRFGATGVMSNALLLPLVGLLIGLVVSAIAEHRLTRKLIGVVGIIGASLCLVVLIVFGLDAVQTRAAVRPEMRTGFATAAFGAAVKVAIAGVVSVTVAVAALARKGVKILESRDIILFSGASARVKGDA